MEISAASGGLPSGPASSGSGSTAIRKPLMFCYSFLLFFYLLVPIGFPKGKKKSVLGQKAKRSIKTSVLGIVFGSFLHQRCEMVHSLILRGTLTWMNPFLAFTVTEGPQFFRVMWPFTKKLLKMVRITPQVSFAID